MEKHDARGDAVQAELVAPEAECAARAEAHGRKGQREEPQRQAAHRHADQEWRGAERDAVCRRGCEGEAGEGGEVSDDSGGEEEGETRESLSSEEEEQRPYSQ